VTDNERFNDIIRGAWWWGPFDRETAGPGTAFRKGHLMDEKVRQWDYYIVDWEPYKVFSMGGSRNKWDFRFRLRRLDNGKTELECCRRFNALGVLPFAKEQVEYTANAVAGLLEAKNV
jgi:hypothetical protein